MNFQRNLLQTAVLVIVLLVGCDKPENFLYFQPTVPENKVEQPGSIVGAVTNALDGNPLVGVTVVAHPSTPGQIDSITQTDGGGNYSIGNLPAGAYAMDFTLFGFSPILAVPLAVIPNSPSTQNESMSPLLSNGQFRFVTTWCGPTVNAVRDVDSYLHIPGEAANSPIGFANLNDGLGANLDHDDVWWYGPETITITTLKQGTYNYYVNNFNIRSDLTALGNSDVVTQVYDGSQLVKTYHIPAGTGITYAVFDIVNGTIVDVEQYDDTLFVY